MTLKIMEDAKRKYEDMKHSVMVVNERRKKYTIEKIRKFLDTTAFKPYEIKHIFLYPLEGSDIMVDDTIVDVNIGGVTVHMEMDKEGKKGGGWLIYPLYQCESCSEFFTNKKKQIIGLYDLYRYMVLEKELICPSYKSDINHEGD